MTVRVLAIALLLTLACSPDPITRVTRTTSGGGSTLTSSTSAGGAGGGGGGQSTPGEPIVVGPSTGAVSVPFTLSAQGSGSGFVGEIDIAGNVGTAVVEGQMRPLVVYERQPFKNYYLYQSLVVASDRLYVVWLYCLGGVLQGVYYEGTQGTPLGAEGATGACAESDTPSTATASFGALTMPYPNLVAGFTVDGPAVQLDGAKPGTIAVGGKQHVLLGFTSVDCSECLVPGWWELHALLWDGEHVCFGILYFIDGKSTVQLDYALCLPELADPFGAVLLDATWTTPG